MAVEWLEDRLLLAADYGDAAASYSAVAFGAVWHEAIGPTLGLLRDAEPAGAPSASADSDDAAGADDEDGVQFGPLRAGQVSAAVNVLVADAPTGARLDAWIDFDGDGAFLGAHERIAANAPVVAGTNSISFDVPASAQSGPAVSRFRLSTAGGLSVAGGAADGEVEDHLATILPPRASAGLFGAAQTVAGVAVLRPVAEVAVDLDEDGDLDVLLSGADPSRIIWYENDGAELFTPHELVSAETAVYDLAAGDIDGDGDRDLFGAMPSSERIVWFENDGQLHFTERLIAGVTSAWTGAELADLDSDGDLDVVKSEYVGRLNWYENDGAGQFTTRLIDAALQSPRRASVADVNGDGRLDVVVAAYYADVAYSAIAWYQNDGAENFTRRIAVSNSYPYMSAVAGDVDSDGDVDFVSIDYNTRQATWHENDGAYSFTSRPIADSRVQRLLLADVDGDDDRDILGWDEDSYSLTLYENDGHQNFTLKVVDGAVPGIYDVEVVDVDGNGVLDILAAAYWNSSLGWYARSAAGGWAESVIVLAPYGGAVHAADLDRDGDQDIVAFHHAERYWFTPIVWHENLGGGRFRTRLIDKSFPEALDLRVVDLDGDGDLDLVVTSIEASTIDWLENDGQQRFIRRRIATGAHWPFTPNIVDFEGDGDEDVIVGDITLGSVNLYANLGSGVFGKRSLAVDSPYDYQTAAADLDGDGDVDVLATHGGSLGFAIHENLGGTYLVARPVAGSTTAREPLTADFDGDGRLDVLATSGSLVTLYVNGGALSFTRHVVAQTGYGWEFYGLRAADFDGDGDLDFMAVDSDGVNYTPQIHLAWYENLGNYTFEERLLDDQRRITSAAAIDLDGDGDLDVAAIDYQHSVVVRYENRPTLAVAAGSQPLIEETASPWIITISRQGDAAQELAVAFTVNGSATFGNDYTLAGATSFDGGRGVAVIPAGVDAVELVVTIVDDEDVEPNDWLHIEVTPPAGYELTTTGTAVVSIASLDFRGDYGDAPASYGTLLTDNGPRHLAAGPTLGADRDAENNGSPSAGAAGDGADDDGVAITPIRAGEVDAAWTVDVRDAPTGARLDAWIDFNADGAFDLAHERIAAGLGVVEGPNSLRFAVPADAR
ncbi:MAG: hypothetical protein DCC67_17240, partial [Planctomycetota bacterium]